MTDSLAKAARKSADAVTFLHRRGLRVRRTARRSYIAALWHAAHDADPKAVQVLREHHRLIHAVERDVRDFVRGARRHPAATFVHGGTMPRVLAIARDYLDATRNDVREKSLMSFLLAYQETAELGINELWALKPAIEHELLERMLAENAGKWQILMPALRRITEITWKDVVENASVVHRVLADDPAGAYSTMDPDSREFYRSIVAGFAERSQTSESKVAEMAVQLCREVGRVSDGSRAAVRRMHVGYYLLDAGLPVLRQAIGYRQSLRERLGSCALRYPAAYYLIGIELLTMLAIWALLSGVPSLAGLIPAVLLLLLPASQAAVDIMNSLSTFLVAPRRLPKLELSDGVPNHCLTLVAVPSLLLNETQVRDLALDLEIRFLANRDRNIYYALLTDSPDSDEPVDERDKMVEICAEAVRSLNQRYGEDGRQPFLMLHRHRTFNESEGRWMGWERKRGKLLDLNRVCRGGFDSFPVKVGDVKILRRVRYVITLDSDTQLPRDSAIKLIGTIAHPLNQAVVDPATKMVVEGYGILQPRIGISIQSAGRSRLASLYSGQTGFDIYTRAISDVYQDVFGEAIFTGKGIYEVDTFLDVLEQRFPDNSLLSHDLIEGAYARVALVSDIELIDDYPSHFSAYSRRKHRWVRGDWQILRWLRASVPDYHNRIIANPIALVSRWKIIDNLRRSLLEPALLALLIGGWLFLPGKPLYWTLAAFGLLFMPAVSGLVFRLMRIPREPHAILPWAREAAWETLKAAAIAVLGLVFLLHQALLSLDAIARSVLRVFVTRRRLLEWETAAEAESQVRRKARVDVYLTWTPWISAAIGIAVWLIGPQAFAAAAPVLLLWFVSWGFSDWLNRSPRVAKPGLRPADEELVRESAERIYRFFHDWSSETTHWLIPDNVHEDGAVAMRVSPTNIGMLLNARIAAVHLNLSTREDFARETMRTLETVQRMKKHRGHLLNWYDAATLEPLQPEFVSTVDSGNLAAALWTLKQAATEFDLTEIASICDRLVSEMDFRFLYNQRKKVLSVGYDAGAGNLLPSCYDLLASESRIATFVAIAKGDIPQEAWFSLGRAHTLVRGEKVLLSWTGTMFEYLMPALWMRHYSGTITAQSVDAAVRVQRDYARRKGVPWGISESACSVQDGTDYGYEPFGIGALAMKPADPRSLVVSPYSSFLALAVDPGASLRNLRRMEEFEWSGLYGFYESVDYSAAGGEVVRMWMAHHQGMSLLAACNLLCGSAMQRHFHAEPQVLATELLLHERVPAVVVVRGQDAALEAAA